MTEERPFAKAVGQIAQCSRGDAAVEVGRSQVLQSLFTILKLLLFILEAMGTCLRENSK